MTNTNEHAVLQYLGREDYRPLSKSELARALQVSPKDRVALRETLRQLESRGMILKGKKGRFSLPSAGDGTVVGVFHSLRFGMGELVPSDGQKFGKFLSQGQRLLIPDGRAGTALDGDHVVVRLRRTEEPPWLKHLPKAQQEKMKAKFGQGTQQRPEGEVIRVLKRKERRIVGTLAVHAGMASLHPDNDRLPKRIDLPDGLPKQAAAGDKAVATIDEWESVRKAPIGRVLKVLGPANQPGVDILSIIHKHGLPTEFPDEVLKEADAIGEIFIDAHALAEREDWRENEVITIDPFDARDFDDAIAVKALDDGGWELAVHIADVAHYVRQGSALDREAEHRGNSVYLVDRVLPMLPEKLSNGICSLKPDTDRLTFCALMRFDAKGRRGKTRLFPAVIRSLQRLSYEQAMARLKDDSEKEDPVTDLLKRAWALAAKLRKRRFKDGSLDLDFPETKVLLDEQGRPTDMRVIEHDESHQLIEEFMLAANEAVAETMLRSEHPALYRIHEDPDPDKLLEFRDVAIAHGIVMGDLTHRSELQSLLKKIRGRPDEHLLKLAFLKSLKRAAYSADPLGHFGLAKANYTHFTSPIRRYADLVVHRVLRKILILDSAGKTPNQKHMTEIADHLSRTERVAADAEMETKQLKIVEYFEKLSRRKPPKQFEAVVVEVARIGLFVEIVGLQTRGLIRVSDLPGEQHYRFDPSRMRYVGKKQRVFQLGDTLDVELARVDRQRGFVDFRVVE